MIPGNNLDCVESDFHSNPVPYARHGAQSHIVIGQQVLLGVAFLNRRGEQALFG